MPFGGRTQRTPAQAMAAVFPVLPGQETDQASVMAWGCDPEQTCTDPYTGAYNAVYTLSLIHIFLLQKAVEVLPDDTPETLQRRVMEQAEWLLLPRAAELVSEQIVKEKSNA